MIDLIERHRILFFFILPLTMFAGIGFAPAAVAISGLGVLYLFYKGNHDSIVLFFFLTLIMGDSRADWLQFFKPMRASIILLMAIFTVYEIRNNYYKANALMLYLLPFLWIAMLALIFSPDLSTGVSKTFSFGLLYFMTLNYLHHKLERYGIQLVVDALYICVFLLAIGFVFIPVIPELVTYGGLRYNGMLGNPNGMGMFVTLLSPLAFYLFRRDPRFSKRFKAFTWTLLIVSLLMCSSRNAIFSVAIFFMLSFALEGSTFRKVSFIFVLFPTAAFLIYNIDMEALVYDLGLESYFRIKEFGSGSGRIFAWKHAADLIEKSPLIGCGFACEEYFFVQKPSFQLWHSGHQGGVHNSYLAFAINTGIVGLIAYLGFLANTFRKVRNINVLAPFVASAMFSALFESWLFSSLSAFHIMFLMTLVFFIVDTNREELLVSSQAHDFSNIAAEGNMR